MDAQTAVWRDVEVTRAIGCILTRRHDNLIQVFDIHGGGASTLEFDTAYLMLCNEPSKAAATKGRLQKVEARFIPILPLFLSQVSTNERRGHQNQKMFP